MAQLDFVPDPPDIIVIYKQGDHLKVDIDQMLVNKILGRGNSPKIFSSFYSQEPNPKFTIENTIFPTKCHTNLYR